MSAMAPWHTTNIILVLNTFILIVFYSLFFALVNNVLDIEKNKEITEKVLY